MRYTTVIDLSEIPQVYANPTAVRVYLHLALKCGYHDNDRDIVTISLRILARSLGITVSAARHSLKILTAHGLLQPTGGSTFQVLKWVTNKPISKRAKTDAEQKARERREQEEREFNERRRKEREEDKKREALIKEGKSTFTEYYENYILPLAERGDPEGIRLKEQHAKYYEQECAALREAAKKALQ
ncbi:MAG: hypothetical protein IKV82_08245 [Akkermansia sp.]|nr:hypothetical protein [Akkermansia sp.]